MKMTKKMYQCPWEIPSAQILVGDRRMWLACLKETAKVLRVLPLPAAHLAPGHIISLSAQRRHVQNPGQMDQWHLQSRGKEGAPQLLKMTGSTSTNYH